MAYNALNNTINFARPKKAVRCTVMTYAEYQAEAKRLKAQNKGLHVVHHYKEEKK